MLVGTRKTAGERDRVKEVRFFVDCALPVAVAVESPEEFPRGLGLRVEVVYLGFSPLCNPFSENARPRKSEGKPSSLSSSSEL